ncbi:Zinc finger TFIIB-type domain-containing protein [Natrialba chahannaoensis JCM 10990]|uniref:Zinc finger TFIIB-type domain-containing protein n=1 Tax=Natrialba chahannaoensis JCM 10990 TaxID=1227492 RepID=M0B670_9EURY|nr:Zinc finger TFIIB-type domain-containing protein [Natrialba chahannaoensis JCM 10990]
MERNDSPTHCPECDGILRERETETICEECGAIVDTDLIDRGPEWRSFVDDPTDRRRTGAPLTRSRHDRGLSTMIGYGSGSQFDQSTRITGRKRRQLTRLQREHTRSQIATKAEYNQIRAFNEIRCIVARLSLTDPITEQACALFDNAQSENLLQGRSLEGFAAAVVYAICRTHNLPRTIDEIVTVASADEAELKAAYTALNRELGLETGPIDPTDYLPRFASELDLEMPTEKRAHEHVTALQQANRICGSNPSGVAAACLYHAAGERDEWPTITQAEAADVADVAPTTIRTTHKKLEALETKTEVETESEQTAASETNGEPELETDTEIDAGIDTETEGETEPDSASEPKPRTDTNTDSRAEVASGSDRAKSEVEANTGSESRSDSRLSHDPDSDLEPD